MATYTPTNNTVATYGEKSQAVLDLQKKLNTYGAGLKEDSMYGPLTLAAYNKYKDQINAPSPTDTPVKSEDSAEKYYPRVSEDYNTKRQDLMDAAYSMNAPDLDTIREQMRQNSQGLIDAIQAEYAGIIADESIAGRKREKRTRGLNVSSNLQGSDFASAEAQKTEDANKKIMDTIKAERAAKIAGVLSGVSQRAMDQFEKQKTEYRQSAEARLGLLEQFKEEALNDVSVLIEGGLTSDRLKSESPETWQQLLEQTGYTDAGLSAYFASQQPEADQVFKEKVGNNMVFGYRDPDTGEIRTEKVPLAEGYSDFTKIDGEPYFVDKESGKIIPAIGYTPKASGSKPYVSGTFETDEAALGGIRAALNETRGEDDWVDSSVYKETHDLWRDSGGKTEDFLKQFPPEYFVNPNDKSLPVSLRNTTKVDDGGDDLGFLD